MKKKFVGFVHSVRKIRRICRSVSNRNPDHSGLPLIPCEVNEFGLKTVRKSFSRKEFFQKEKLIYDEGIHGISEEFK